MNKIIFACILGLLAFILIAAVIVASFRFIDYLALGFVNVMKF